MTDKMKEAINLLQKEEFYLCKTNGKSVWLSYNLGVSIHTKTMKALENRGIVKTTLSINKNAESMAILNKYWYTFRSRNQLLLFYFAELETIMPLIYEIEHEKRPQTRSFPIKKRSLNNMNEKCNHNELGHYDC